MTRAATQIASKEFDAVFFSLPPDAQDLIQRKIDGMGLRLANFPHYRMSGSSEYRLRVGDYRIIYEFDTVKAEIYLNAMGHRRQIYRHRL